MELKSFFCFRFITPDSLVDIGVTHLTCDVHSSFPNSPLLLSLFPENSPNNTDKKKNPGQPPHFQPSIAAFFPITDGRGLNNRSRLKRLNRSRTTIQPEVFFCFDALTFFILFLHFLLHWLIHTAGNYFSGRNFPVHWYSPESSLERNRTYLIPVFLRNGAYRPVRDGNDNLALSRHSL